MILVLFFIVNITINFQIMFKGQSNIFKNNVLEKEKLGKVRNEMNNLQCIKY